MPVIARDAFAAGHLVYAWPFPVGPECEVSCRDDEQVVMCPAWTIGDRLGPGRHLWRTPDPSRPVSVYFVSHGSIDVEFEMVTRFTLPATNQPIQIRVNGSVLVRCGDPGVLIAQFIGLPFDGIDDGIKRSVARSVERMVARLLTRRVVMAGTIEAITDPTMLQPIIEEIVSYNPTAGAVFGIELSQLSRMQIEASDGRITQISPPLSQQRYGDGSHAGMQVDGHYGHHHGHHGQHQGHINGWGEVAMGTLPPGIPESVPHHDTQRGVGQAAASGVHATSSGVMSAVTPDSASGVISGMTGGTPPGPISASHNVPTLELELNAGGHGNGAPAISGMASGTGSSGVVSGEMSSSASPSQGVVAAMATGSTSRPNIKPPMMGAAPPPSPAPVRRTETLPPPMPSIPPRPITSPGGVIGGPGAIVGGGTPPPDLSATSAEGSTPRAPRLASEPDARSSIMAIGARIGDRQVTSGEILSKVEPGKRVLVPGPHGLMQSATVRQLLSGYYELEVGSSGETIWVPMAHVVPDP